jgi:hypothetical protein
MNAGVLLCLDPRKAETGERPEERMAVVTHAMVIASLSWPGGWLMVTAAGVVVVAVLAYGERPDWRGLSALYPAPENLPDVSFRQFLHIHVWVGRAGHAPRRRYGQCLVGLEPGGIRVAHGRAAREDRLEALIPWDEIDSFAEDDIGDGEGSIPVHRLRLLTRRDEILIGRPAGEAAWIQWRMVKAHGPGTPIIGA